MRKILLIIILLLSVKNYAQIDSTYYKKEENKDMFISASVYRNLFSLRLMEASENTYFLPNEIGRFSVGVSHPKLPFDIAIGTSVGKVNKDFPKTKSMDIQVHKYARKFVVDGFYQKYKGFYIDHYNKKQSNNDFSIEQRSYADLDMLLIGAFGQYVFNGNKFSYQSAFNNSKEVQLKSAGSALAGANVYYFDLKSSKPITEDVNKINELQFGINGGYSYNFVLGPKWLLNLSASGGLNFNRKWKVRPSYLVRGSCFYTSGNWSVGALAVSNTITLINTKKMLGNLDSGTVSLVAIKRFKLKKKKKK